MLVIILAAITSHLRVAKVSDSVKFYKAVCNEVFKMFVFIYSNVFMMQFAKSKLQAVEMMKKISKHVTDHCILERIVPYLVS